MWLEIELEKLWIKKYLSPITIKPLLEQAKAMEKKQCVDFAEKAVRMVLDEDIQNPVSINQLYNETFEKS